MTKISYSPESLHRDFSIEASPARDLIMCLYRLLGENLESNSKVFSLFDEWEKTFRYIYGGVLDKSKLIADFRGISKKIFKTQEPLHVDRFLFVLYTYYSLLIKIIASEIACINLRLPFAALSRLLMQSGNELAQNLVSIEDGTFFKQYLNVKNYIERGFFSWYLECWEENLEKNIRIILSKVNQYDPKTLFNSGHRVSDLLRHLFQNIVPKRIRHDLGEYYTPQWLAQLAIEEAGYAGDPNQKVLDPGCGSGTFLVEIINVLKNRNLPQMDKKDLLALVLRNVVGFDVNPVAVLTAGTNYLLAISDLISPDYAQPIIIPVYLTDSILTPTTSGSGELRENVYHISTTDGIFKIPQELVHNDRLPAFFNLVEESMAANDLPQDFLARLNKQVAHSEEICDIILEFYSAIADLHEAGKAKTWLKIIQNSFAPLLYTDFDYIVGNPPWIKWDFLSPEYKNKLGGLYLQIYKLYSYSGMNAGMGFAHDDISIVFTYVCMDKYLKNGGTLSFVLKQTLYKSIAGREFRKFAIERSAGEVIPVKIRKVLDLLDLKPFKDAGSETSIAILEKGTQTTYPVPYYNWRLHGVVEDEMDLDEVRQNSLVEEFQAAPDPASGDPTDVWVVTANEPKLETGSYEENSYSVRHGVVNDLNSVFFVKILGKTNGDLVITNEQIGKKIVHPIQTDIEKDLVYPIVKPRHVKKWLMKGYKYIIIPQKKQGENNESEVLTTYPKTYAYLQTFRDDLLGRSSRWFKGGDKPFYSLFGIGDYTFAPFKVVWSSIGFLHAFAVISTVTDEFIGTKEVIPDNTIGYLSFDAEQEAHYACAILNSNVIREMFSRRSTKSKWGISISMVKHVPIPPYNPDNPVHHNLAALSRQAHELARSTADTSDIERQVNLIVPKCLNSL